MTGLDLVSSSDSSYATSTQVKGKVYAADYALDTPAQLITAVLDMGAAYNNVTGRANPDYSEIAAGEEL